MDRLCNTERAKDLQLEALYVIFSLRQSFDSGSAVIVPLGPDLHTFCPIIKGFKKKKVGKSGSATTLRIRTNFASLKGLCHEKSCQTETVGV